MLDFKFQDEEKKEKHLRRMAAESTLPHNSLFLDHASPPPHKKPQASRSPLQSHLFNAKTSQLHSKILLKTTKNQKVEIDYSPLCQGQLDIEILQNLESVQKQDIINVKNKNEILKRWHKDLRDKCAIFSKYIESETAIGMLRTRYQGKNASGSPAGPQREIDFVVRNELSNYLDNV